MHNKLWKKFEQYKVHNHGPIDRACYSMLDKYTIDRGVTLETGAGLSTLFFASRSQKHYAISPTDLVNLDKVAMELGISFDNVKMIQGLSDQILPKFAKIDFDFVFIDGGHEFPVPIIDWHYTYKSLKKGGFVGIDDLQLSCPYLLHKFLIKDKHWKLMEANNKTSVFQKLANYDSFPEGWYGQNLGWDDVKIF